MIKTLKIWSLTILSMLSLNVNAQLFFHKDGFYEKTNNHWIEYQITEMNSSGVITNFQKMGQFDEYNDDDNYYYIDNGKYKVAVPKGLDKRFFSLYPNQKEWKELYPSEEFHEILFRDSNNSKNVSYIIYDNGKASFYCLITDDSWFDFPKSITFNNKPYTVDKIDGMIIGNNLKQLWLSSSIIKIERLNISKDNAKKLKEIYIPESVKEISTNRPFGYNSAIEQITLLGTKPYEFSLLFNDMPKLKTIITFRPIYGTIWVTNSHKFKSVENYSRQKVVVRTHIDEDPKYY